MRIKCTLLSLALVFVLKPVHVPAIDLSQNALYLQQKSSNTCTLCASAMMIRSCMQMQGVDNWYTLTEESVKPWAWTNLGLSWNWRWTDDHTSLSVAHQSVNGVTADELCDLLAVHPEGIVLYCGGETHHGVFLTGCTDKVFYCADPAVGYDGKEISLEESLLGTRLGTQDNILGNVTAYWYVDSVSCSGWKTDKSCDACADFSDRML